GQRVLVARLGGGKDGEILHPLVLDQRLVEIGLAVDDIDEVVHHPALATQDEVEVAQTDVEVDHGGLVAGQRQAGRNGGAGGRLAHTSLARGDHDYSCTVCVPPIKKLLRSPKARCYRFSITRLSPLKKTCTGCVRSDSWIFSLTR